MGCFVVLHVVHGYVDKLQTVSLLVTANHWLAACLKILASLEHLQLLLNVKLLLPTGDGLTPWATADKISPEAVQNIVYGFTWTKNMLHQTTNISLNLVLQYILLNSLLVNICNALICI